jgi:hypothetical protein
LILANLVFQRTKDKFLHNRYEHPEDVDFFPVGKPVSVFVFETCSFSARATF